MPVLEQELAFDGFRFAMLPSGQVELHFEMSDTVIDLALRAQRSEFRLNSDRLESRTLAADDFGLLPAGTGIKLPVNNHAPGLLLSFSRGFETRLVTENLRRDVPEWRLVDYEPDPTAAQLGHLAMAYQ
jgi:hypothetical protein